MADRARLTAAAIAGGRPWSRRGWRAGTDYAMARVSSSTTGVRRGASQGQLWGSNDGAGGRRRRPLGLQFDLAPSTPRVSVGGHHCPRSSADRAPASGAGGAGSSPAEGARLKSCSHPLWTRTRCKPSVRWQSLLAIRWLQDGGISEKWPAQSTNEARTGVATDRLRCRSTPKPASAGTRRTRTPGPKDGRNFALAKFVTEVSEGGRVATGPVPLEQVLTKWLDAEKARLRPSSYRPIPGCDQADS